MLLLLLLLLRLLLLLLLRRQLLLVLYLLLGSRRAKLVNGTRSPRKVILNEVHDALWPTRRISAGAHEPAAPRTDGSRPGGITQGPSPSRGPSRRRGRLPCPTHNVVLRRQCCPNALEQILSAALQAPPILGLLRTLPRQGQPVKDFVKVLRDTIWPELPISGGTRIVVHGQVSTYSSFRSVSPRPSAMYLLCTRSPRSSPKSTRAAIYLRMSQVYVSPTLSTYHYPGARASPHCTALHCSARLGSVLYATSQIYNTYTRYVQQEQTIKFRNLSSVAFSKTKTQRTGIKNDPSRRPVLPYVTSHQLLQATGSHTRAPPDPPATNPRNQPNTKKRALANTH